MLITKLNGGLGNQMFQYAAGRRLACLRKTDLKLDISIFSSYKLRTYALNFLNIKEIFATTAEVDKLTRKKQGVLERRINKILFRQTKRPATYIKEEYYCFNPKILDLSDNVYLEGYWQSEKYFEDIEPTIRKEFTVKSPQTGENKEFAKIISSCESVSMHIRRGDYVSNSKTIKTFGVCSRGYYLTAIKKITASIKNPHFFIFSDDLIWVKEKLRFDYPTTIISYNGQDRSYEDLRLMSLCKHNIIANSSFSWWGAWLNKNPNKIVIAPTKWLNQPDNAEKYKNFTDDLILPEWITL